ncbi:hypothetical protein ACOMHN_030391 [Nucella lapillus]
MSGTIVDDIQAISGHRGFCWYLMQTRAKDTTQEARDEGLKMPGTERMLEWKKRQKVDVYYATKQYTYYQIPPPGRLENDSHMLSFVLRGCKTCTIW